MRSGTLRPIALAGVAMLAAGVALAGCGKADTGGGGSAASGELTLWTHNAGNKEELAVVNQIVADYNASQTKTHGQGAGLPAGRRTTTRSWPRRRRRSCPASWTPTPPPCPTGPSPATWPAGPPQDLRRQAAAQHPRQVPGQAVLDRLLRRRALAMFARKSALTAAGARIPTLDQPWTAAEFDQALAKIKAAGKYPIAFDLGTGDTGTEWWTYAYSPFLQSFGGDLIDRNTYKTADGVLNGDKAMAWATWMQGLVEEGVLAAEVQRGRVRRLRQRQVGHGVVRDLELREHDEAGRRRRHPAAARLRQRPEDRRRLVAVGDQRGLREQGGRAWTTCKFSLDREVPWRQFADEAERHPGHRGGRRADARLAAGRAASGSSSTSRRSSR